MSESYTLLWSKIRCEQFVMSGHVGQPLTMLFGGPHQSEPRFRRFGVREGDYLYPIQVSKGVLHVLGRVRVTRLVSLPEYISQSPKVFSGCDLNRRPEDIFLDWLMLHPEMHCLAPTCTDEVALVQEEAGIRFDATVPPDLLERLRFCSQKGERGLKGIVNGQLKSVISLQGVYRLCEESACEIEKLLKQPS